MLNLIQGGSSDDRDKYSKTDEHCIANTFDKHINLGFRLVVDMYSLVLQGNSWMSPVRTFGKPGRNGFMGRNRIIGFRLVKDTR